MNSQVFFAWSFFACLSAFVLPGCATTRNESTSSRVYELRTYYAAPEKLDDLHSRFRDHTMRLFEKHGMENLGYWVPLENSENKLVFLLGYPNREARDAAWKIFMIDPEWKAVQQRSEANGKLVDKVEQVFLERTDYSPTLKKGNVSRDGVFELRNYTTPPGKLPSLDARFRNYTMRLFTRHGMNHWLYFHMLPYDVHADTNLVYFLTHKSAESAKASFSAFRNDPEWIAAKTASELQGSLTVKDGVKSEILVPTDYSPTW